MPSPVTYPLTAVLKRIGWYAAEAAAWTVGDMLLDEADYEVGDSWRRLSMVIKRTSVGSGEDAAIVTWDIANFTGGSLDGSWTPADYSTVEGHFLTWWGTVKTQVSSTHTLHALNWYVMKFRDPMTEKHRFAESGPPERITIVDVPGTNTGEPMPYQIALCVTEKTAWPRHAGRFYLPGPTEQHSSSIGRFNFSYMDSVLAATDTLYTALKLAQFPVVVASTQQDNVLNGVLLIVTQIEADDVPDVQRRRQSKASPERHVQPIGS